MQKKAEASVIMDLDIFSSVSSKNTKVVEFINYQNSYDCSLFFVKFIFLYLLQMGGLCLNPTQNKKQPQVVYEDPRSTAMVNLQNAKKLEEIQMKERQIAKLMKEKQDLKMAHEEYSKKYANDLNEERKNHKIKEDKIK